MFGFGESNDAVQQVENTDDEHKGSLTHEAIAGAASFYAFKKFEDSQRSKGETVNHETAKALLAAFAGGEADKLIETKGLDGLDREKAKRQAQHNVQSMYDQQYGQYDQYDPNNADQQQPDFSASQY